MSAGAPARPSIEVASEHLAAALDVLSAPPAARDPVLWAAHEAVTYARTLLAMRDEDDGGAAPDWDAALASARASMASLSYARREAAPPP